MAAKLRLCLGTLLVLLISSLLVQGQPTYFTAAPSISSNTLLNEGQRFNIQFTTLNDSTGFDDNYNISLVISGDVTGSDYIISPSSLIFSINDTAANVTVTIINDSTVEANETFTITFTSTDSSVVFEPSSINYTIISNDILNVSILNTSMVTVNEQEIFKVLASYSNPDNELSFNLIARPSSADLFPTAVVLPFTPSSNLLIANFSSRGADGPGGVKTTSIVWTVPEQFSRIVRIVTSNVTPVTIRSQLVLSLANSSAVVNTTESNTVVLCVMSNGTVGPSDVTLNFTISGDPADISTVQPASRQLLFSNGSNMSCLSVTIMDDSFIEGTETVSVGFSNPVGASFTGVNVVTINIKDDDYVSIMLNTSVTVSDNNDSFMLCASVSDNTLSFSPSVNNSLSLSAITINGTAKSGIDFMPIPMNFISMIPGCGTVTLMNVRGVDGRKQFNISWQLTTPTDNIMLATPTTVVNIRDTDTATIGFQRDGYTVMENQLINHVNVLIESGAISAPFNISVNAIDGTAKAGNNFRLNSNYSNFMWPSGQTEIQIYFTIINDNIFQPNNLYFNLSVSVVTTELSIVLERANIQVTINNDDLSPSPTPSPRPSASSILVSSSPSSVMTISPPPTSSSSPTPSSPPTTTSFVLSTVALVGIIVGVVILGLFLLLLLVCAIACVKVKSNREGFYTTYEDKEDAPQMLRYSASLRSLQSQTVMPLDPREKENEYMV